MTRQREDILYRPSLNPYYSKLMALESGAFADKKTETLKGEWRKQFASQQTGPLHVELGCNGGHVVLEWAKENPTDLFIGLDYKFKQIYLAHEKAKKRKLDNVIFLRAIAERIEHIFGPSEIDFLYLYFPDPWPKKAHLKNRTVTPEWLKNCASVVKKGGVFHIKTDHAGYADWIRAAIAEVRDIWDVTEDISDLYKAHPDPESLKIPQVTLFERLFIKDKIPIHSVKLVRK